MEALEVIGPVALAVGLGAVIGLEREFGAQPAGLRTHILVCLGSTVFTLAGASVLGTDPTRVAAQVVTGIGFLGGGAILREGPNIRGLTTAASLWVTAAIGLAVGLRAFLAAVVSTVLAVLVLGLVKYVEQEIFPERRSLAVRLRLTPGTDVPAVERAAVAALPRPRVLRAKLDDEAPELVLEARPRAKASLAALGDMMRALPGVEHVQITR